jgi:hypothetical protein
VLGWQSIHDDTMLFIVYITCYFLDSIIRKTMKLVVSVTDPESENLLCQQQVSREILPVTCFE